MPYLGFYILTMLDVWTETLFFTSICGFILTSIGFIPMCISSIAEGVSDEEYNSVLKRFKIKGLYTLFISLFIISMLLPTTKQAAFIWIAPQIVENGAVKDTVKNIPELTKLGTDYLKKLLKEKTNDSGRTD